MSPIDPDALRRFNELELNLRKVSLEIEAQKKTVDQFADALKLKDAKVAELESEIDRLNKTNADLNRTVSELKSEKPMIEVGCIARQFRKAIESINEEALEQSKNGKISSTIDNFEVEIKGGIDVKDGIKLVQPAEVTDQTVSILRFSLRPIASIRIPETNKIG